MSNGIIKTWGYGEDRDVKVNGSYERISIRFIGKTSITKFIKAVLNGDTRGYAWVRARIGETGNDFELDTIEQNPNTVIVYNTRTHEILERRNIE